MGWHPSHWEKELAARTKALAAARRAHRIAAARVAAAKRVIARNRAKAPSVKTGSFGLDWAWGHPDPKALKEAGVRFACRYLSFDTSKNLNAAEAMALKAAGIPVVVVWETTANRALGGRAAGAADARVALAQAKACGIPDDRPIYFAVDFDESPQQATQVATYFLGVNSVLGVKRTGAYAGYWGLSRLFDAKVITYGWQTYAWSGGNLDKRAHLFQYSNGHRVAGVSCDFDKSLKRDFGQWFPR